MAETDVQRLEPSGRLDDFGSGVGAIELGLDESRGWRNLVWWFWMPGEWVRVWSGVVGGRRVDGHLLAGAPMGVCS